MGKVNVIDNRVRPREAARAVGVSPSLKEELDMKRKRAVAKERKREERRALKVKVEGPKVGTVMMKAFKNYSQIREGKIRMRRHVNDIKRESLSEESVPQQKAEITDIVKAGEPTLNGNGLSGISGA